jgi:hypothetical protein
LWRYLSKNIKNNLWQHLQPTPLASKISGLGVPKIINKVVCDLSKYQQSLFMSASWRWHTYTHRHLSNIDCLMVHTTCLVYFICTVNGHSKKKKPWKTGASSGHITNLKQSILETFNIYAYIPKLIRLVQLFTKLAPFFVPILGHFECKDPIGPKIESANG